MSVLKQVKMWSLAIAMTASGAVFSDDEAGVALAKVKDNIYMITGPGGNVGLFVGDQANVLIDDKFEAQGSPILKLVAEVSNRPLEYVFNTHWHNDHTGSNVVMGNTGATIVAHENVRELLAKGTTLKAFNRVIEPYPKEALPEITFDQSITLHINDETLAVQHIPNAHSNGDSVLYFKKANVVHTGDLFFNGIYPFIDAEHGGRIKGMIAGIQMVLGQINADTVIIPGHGPLATVDDLHAFKAMLEATVAALEPLMAQGLSTEEIVAKQPTKALDEQWGKGFLSPDQWVAIAVSSLQQ
ncbi:MBL fold metallo-hydrolase [Halioxenophilus aromaticivorans]|uniref:MBL fold metallo-hydrolase n=1 Tax=Halioxenophilus aromaticivorans TaxID=1306992 RepID=A0AAV3TYX2_9ALTE